MSTARTTLRVKGNLLLELDDLNDNAVLTKFTWGLDLSGQNGNAITEPGRVGPAGLHAAGGIGGLLAMKALALEQGQGEPLSFSGSLTVLGSNGNLAEMELQGVVPGEGGAGVSPVVLQFSDESGNAGAVALADAAAPSAGDSLAYTDSDGNQTVMELADVETVDEQQYLVFSDGAGNVGVSMLAGLDRSHPVPPQEIGVTKYLYCYDATLDDAAHRKGQAGNVGQLIDWEHSGTVAAHYEYDPYGGTLVAAGRYAASNPFRFSTKYFDGEIDYPNTNADGLYYYGERRPAHSRKTLTEQVAVDAADGLGEVDDALGVVHSRRGEPETHLRRFSLP